MSDKVSRPARCTAGCVDRDSSTMGGACSSIDANDHSVKGRGDASTKGINASIPGSAFSLSQSPKSKSVKSPRRSSQSGGEGFRRRSARIPSESDKEPSRHQSFYVLRRTEKVADVYDIGEVLGEGQVRGWRRGCMHACMRDVPRVTSESVVHSLRPSA